MTVIDDTIEEDHKKKIEDDTCGRVHISDKMGKITQEIQTKTPRNVAALISTRTPNPDGSGEGCED